MSGHVKTRIQKSYETITLNLYVTDCPTCGVIYAVTEELEARRRSDGRTMYCPNGHTSGWHETDLDREKKGRKVAEARAAELQDDLAHKRRQLTSTRNSLRSQKGVTTRLKRRVNHGSCPHCHRNFKQLRQHVARMHPKEVLA